MNPFHKPLHYITLLMIPCLAGAQEKPKALPKSVKPGINKSFLDPDLDVDQYVKRFEIESREVYSARHRVLDACKITDGDVVADIGAGTGLFTQLFSVEVGKGWVYAVDIAPRFLKYIQSSAEKANRNNITTILCSDNNSLLPANAIDIAFICDTYHHFEFPKETLQSIRKAMKEDGTLIVIDFHRVEGKTREWLFNHVRAGQEVFQKEIESCGFKFVAETRIPRFKENYFLKFQKTK
jgi:ubiquinone/menaquinone biosynthesis C-methylase UbiE